MTALDNFGNVFGFANWNLGLGAMGNLFVWLFLSLIVVGFVLTIIIIFYYKRVYKHQIITIGKIGNVVTEKWTAKAREYPIARAGDRLFFIRKMKKYIAPPTIAIGKNKWLHYERKDGELINVGYEDLDEKMEFLGLNFVDTDVRLLRLAINKNLDYRFEKQGFWEKHGDIIINFVFYILVTMLLVVMFMQWRKAGEALKAPLDKADIIMDKMLEYERGKPLPKEEGSGVIPAMILPLMKGGDG